MRKWLYVFIIVGLGVIGKVGVRAGEEACPAEYPYCYDYTIVNQWACETCPGQMEGRCTYDTDISCDDKKPDHKDPAKCGYDNPYCWF